MLCSAGYGIGVAKWNAGGPGSCTEVRASSKRLRSPVWHHTMPHIFRPWSPSGNGGAGGMVNSGKKP